jgi:hypothetical protein
MTNKYSSVQKMCNEPGNGNIKKQTGNVTTIKLLE